MPDSITTIQYKQAENYRKIIAEKIPVGSIIPAHTADGHFYKVGDKTYPSVTGALQILKDPSLANWKMNRALEYAETTLYNLTYGFTKFDPIDYTQVQSVITVAKTIPQQEFEDAGSIGTIIHNARQDYFQQWIDTGERPSPMIFPAGTDPRLISGMRALYKFCDDTGYIPVCTELLLWSDKLGIAGTLDDLGIINGKLVLLDLKSSNQIKYQYFFQVAFYYQMLVERTGLKPRESFILRVSKENGTYEMKYLKNLRKLVSYCKAILKVDEGIQFASQSLKRETIKL